MTSPHTNSVLTADIGATTMPPLPRRSREARSVCGYAFGVALAPTRPLETESLAELAAL
jgi:hypothetical protein